MRKILLTAALGLTSVLFIHCDDDTTAIMAGADLSVSDDRAMSQPETLMACLDRPDDDLPRPPGDTLPCELIPPGI
jgi:hypothetical protein